MAALNDPTPYAGQFSGQTRAAYAVMLKIWYGRRWDDWTHEANMIMQMVGQKGERMGGSKVVAAVVTGFPQSAGITSRETRGLPSPRVGTQIGPELLSRDFYTRLAWTGQAERSAAAGDKAAFSKPRQLDMELARKQSDINLCRKIYLGYYDVLGGVSAYNGGTLTVTLFDRNSRTSAGEAFWYAGNFYCRVNQSLGFAAAPSGVPTYDIEGGATGVVNEVYVVSLGGTNAAPTVVLNVAPSVAPAANDVVIAFHNRALTGYASAADDVGLYSSFNGIDGIATDSSIYGALYGLSKSAAGNEMLNGKYDTGSGVLRAYEERRFTLLVDRIRDEGRGVEPSKAVCHASTRREITAEHDGDRRYAPVQTETGFGQLVQYVGDKGIPIMSDWMCQPGMLIALEPSCWSWVEQSPMGPIDQSLERWVAGFDQHEIIWHKSGNIECQAPADQGILDDLDTDVFSLNQAA